MSTMRSAAGTLAVLGALAVLTVGYVALKSGALEEGGARSERSEDAEAALSGSREGFIYGRVTRTDGSVLEGRLRWGGDEEALWSHTFNGRKATNPWASLVAPDRLEREHEVKAFGITIARRKETIDLGRPFMVRFGDIARIEASGRKLEVVLKSGTAFELDRYEADDFADGLRVWTREGAVVDLEERQVRAVGFLPSPSWGDVPSRLYGTVSTPQGRFSGLIQWNRRKCVGTDRLVGQGEDGEVSVPFEKIESIEPESPDSSRIDLRDRRVLTLHGSRDVGTGNRGLYVDDPRYGRVLIGWRTVTRVDFGEAGKGPSYEDFPSGGPLAGRVSTRDGRTLAGRIVFDLDESETSETLDASAGGVDYSIPFGLIASVSPPRPGAVHASPATVLLHGGEKLSLEPTGDLGASNAGLLVFSAGEKDPQYVAWQEVDSILFDRTAATYPSLRE